MKTKVTGSTACGRDFSQIFLFDTIIPQSRNGEIMIIDAGKKIVKAKICLFGPAMAGKTTLLRSFFTHLGKENKLRSVETTTGRTLFVDFGSIQFGIGGWTLDLLCFTATGQDFYAVTRKYAATQLDGAIFVADANPELSDDNQRSWSELKDLINGQLENAALLVCLNKVDLTDHISEKDLRSQLNLNGTSIIETIATQNQGVEQSFKTILSGIMKGSRA